MAVNNRNANAAVREKFDEFLPALMKADAKAMRDAEKQAKRAAAEDKGVVIKAVDAKGKEFQLNDHVRLLAPPETHYNSEMKRNSVATVIRMFAENRNVTLVQENATGMRAICNCKEVEFVFRPAAEFVL